MTKKSRGVMGLLFLIRRQLSFHGNAYRCQRYYVDIGNVWLDCICTSLIMQFDLVCKISTSMCSM